ncbi:MAG: NTP transferase domain-containing protein [Granulosicoccus sp.]
MALLQARMGSSRLPGKVLMDLEGKSVLERCVERVSRAASVTQTIIATTEDQADNAIAQLCSIRSWPCFRGSEHDVLDRFYHAARCYAADYIVRITCDCPFIDPSLIDRIVHETVTNQAIDYACTANYPRGLDTEVIRFEALEKAWQQDKNSEWRQHVTPYFYHHPEMFTGHYSCHSDDLSALRWTLDTPADYEFIRAIYTQFSDVDFHWQDVLALVQARPELAQINRLIEQKDGSLRRVEKSAYEYWMQKAG